MDQSEEQKISLSATPQVLRNSLRIFRMLWQDKKWLSLAFSFVLLLTSGSRFLRSGAFALLINELIKSAGQGVIGGRLYFFIALTIGAYALPSFIDALNRYFSKLLWFYIDERVQFAVIEQEGNLDIAVRENPKLNDLFNRVEERGVNSVQNFIERQFYMLEGLFSVVIAGIILVSARWWLFALAILGAIPDLLIEGRYGKEVWGIWDSKAEVRRHFWNVRWHFREPAQLVELKTFQNVKHFFSILRDLFRSFQKEERLVDRRRLLSQLSGVLFSEGAYAIAMVWFILQVVKGQMQIGTLTFFLSSIGNLQGALSGFFGNLARQYQASLFVSDVFQFLDIKPHVAKPAVGLIVDSDTTPEIVFEKVSFSYPGTDKPVLKNISLHILPGQKLALVGRNGSGKTTLVKLLCRFYDPTQGRILVGGRDLRQLNLESWYHMLGVLFQDYAHYHFLVRDSIAVGRTSIPQKIEKIKSAAQSSEADIFIEEWEAKYEQMLGRQFSQGVEPSIGQWQKLALARTFYRDPRVLILDEPTSSIDAEAEAKIFEKLETLPPDRTVILISHRFSTVRQANKICVLEDGSISEYGTHKELLKKNKTYAHLFKLQAKGYQ